MFAHLASEPCSLLQWLRIIQDTHLYARLFLRFLPEKCPRRWPGICGKRLPPYVMGRQSVTFTGISLILPKLAPTQNIEEAANPARKLVRMLHFAADASAPSRQTALRHFLSMQPGSWNVLAVSPSTTAHRFAIIDENDNREQIEKPYREGRGFR